MDVTTYLTFAGDCEAAFRFYEQHLGAKVGELFRYGDTPAAAQAPPNWKDKVMHGNITIGGQRFMAADVTPDKFERPAGFSLSIQLSDVAEAERIFKTLSAGGKVVMPLEKTFWAARFGMLVDRFGIRWLVNCDEAQPE